MGRAVTSQTQSGKPVVRLRAHVHEEPNKVQRHVPIFWETVQTRAKE